MIRILHGDCREMLRSLPDASVHCCVTSPPYFSLRDYGVAGQIGLETSPEEYVAELVKVFREVKRVLRPDGTLWLNLGSSYASKVIESDVYVVKRNLPRDVRQQVAQALSSVWSGHESAEQAVQRLSSARSRATEQLSVQTLPNVQRNIHDPHSVSDARAGDLLLSELRSVGQSYPEASDSDCSMSGVRKSGETIASGYPEEKDNDPLLFNGLLVYPQPEDQSLPLGRRSARENGNSGTRLAQSGSEAGPRVLSDLPQQRESGSAPHQAISQPPGSSIRSDERNNALPPLPSNARAERNERGAGIGVDSFSTFNGLEDLAFDRSIVPHGFAQWCEPQSVIKPKDNICIPEMVSLALRDDGWYLRSSIIWHKANPMPESVTDRPTSAHEHVFLLTKMARYFYDADAVREPQISTSASGGFYNKATLKTVLANAEHAPSMTNAVYNPDGRNARDVWTIATTGFADAHFATMAPELAERCIKAGTSEKGCCAACGSPWVRTVTKGEPDLEHQRRSGGDANGGYSGQSIKGHDAHGVQNASDVKRRILEGMREKAYGWVPSCSCGLKAQSPVPCTVLDPFAGAFTTAMVADRLQRNAIGIELNAAYCDMARNRLVKDAGMFADIA